MAGPLLAAISYVLVESQDATFEKETSHIVEKFLFFMCIIPFPVSAILGGYSNYRYCDLTTGTAYQTKRGMIMLNTVTQISYQLTALLQIVQIATASLSEKATTSIWYIVGITGPFYMIILLIVFNRICSGIVMEMASGRTSRMTTSVSTSLNSEEKISGGQKMSSSELLYVGSSRRSSTVESEFDSDRVQIESLGCLILRDTQHIAESHHT